MKKWQLSKIDKELAKNLAEECDVDPFVAMIAASRGYDDPALLEEFLSEELIFSDPYSLSDMEKAVECINNSLLNDELIAVFGDYDCDGVTATALLYSYLRDKGARVIYRIPNRFKDGYGINLDAVKELHAEGVSLIVTVDNGISCFEEIKLANQLGMKVVVTDHHLPPEKLPNAEAIVDPHKKDDFSGLNDICGVGVAFNLVCALEDAEPEEMIDRYGDLVALGTIGDVMPLVGENRSFVKYGLNLIKSGRRLGIEALMKAAGLENNSFSSQRISFGLVPRINAAGRMGSADRALLLLITEDLNEADALATEISEDNTKRQQIEKEIFEEAMSIIKRDGLYNERVIVVSGENWHHGIVGIVASRICEYYGKPAIVLSIEDELAHGSGRSIDGFSLYDSIDYAKEYTVKFGGHSLAAGVTLKKEQIDLFAGTVNMYARSVPAAIPVLNLDCKLNPAALSLDLFYAINVMQPFGAGNSMPVFGIFGAELEKISPVGGGKHLKLSFIKGPAAFQTILFSYSVETFPFKVGDVLDLAVSLDANFYNSREYLSIVLKEFRLSGVDDSDLAQQYALYSDFSSLVPGDYSIIAPTREECGAVYKFIHKSPSSAASLEQRFMNNYGLAKVKIILDVFNDLDLIEQSNDDAKIISVKNIEQKVDLESSAILKRIRG